MANLTKEYFDKQLKKLATKQDLNKGLVAQSKELKAYADRKSEELAHLVAAGFQQEREYWDKKLASILPKLDNFEERINRIEQAVGIIIN